MTFFLFLFYSILVNDRRRLIALFVWSFSNILRPSFLLCVSHYAWKWFFGMQSFLVHSVHRLTDKCTSMMAFSYTHNHFINNCPEHTNVACLWLCVCVFTSSSTSSQPLSSTKQKTTRRCCCCCCCSCCGTALAYILSDVSSAQALAQILIW